MDSILKKQAVPIWTVPSPSLFGSIPDPKLYYRKACIVWNPEQQFDIRIQGKKCNGCQGLLRFKEFSKYRSVYDVNDDCFMMSAVYKCRSCRRCFNSADEVSMVQAGLLPPEVYFHMPVRLFKKSAWTTAMVELMADLVTQRCEMATFISAIAKARTSHYLKQKALYLAHVLHQMEPDLQDPSNQAARNK